MVSISGGADSDIMLDLIIRVAKDENIPLDRFHFVFFNTGIEYQATLKHLDELEEKYGITIERMRAITPVPLGCKNKGVPFLSKHISQNIFRLQKHNFKFEDKDFDTLLKEYPKCKSALQWWCNCKPRANAKDQNKPTRFDIANTPYLKEFMVAHPPTFKISDKCCNGAKKDNSKKFIKENNVDLCCIGVRKAEGGVRATAYKSCFSEATYKQSYDNYRPIFWFTNQDKKEYEEYYSIKHSDCYEKYGFKRTGCCGCPFNKDFEEYLKVVQQQEPKLYTAVNNIFKDSYEYTRAYLKFREQQKRKGKQNGTEQLNFFD
jgi:3'-phosphoadenosine 5'-phosphosulfate sulfotransferase (PAPS reductase)/FAD synthetase